MKSKYLLWSAAAGLFIGYVIQSGYIYLTGPALPQGTYESSMLMLIERNGQRFSLPIESRLEIHDNEFNWLFITDNGPGFSSSGLLIKEGGGIRFIHQKHQKIDPHKADTVLEEALIRSGGLSGKLLLQALDKHSFAIVGEYISLYYKK